MNRFRIFCSAVALLSPAMAKADWQYTRWGMTAAQVSAASGGITEPLVFDPNSVDPMLRNHLAAVAADAPTLRAPYEAGGRKYDADFHFTNDELDRVSLSLKSSNDCYKIKGEMLGSYGQPDEAYERTGVFWWRDIERKNHVMLAARSETNCSIVYKSLINVKENGL
ncbi:hypothetical protein [Sphingobium sp. YR657]|uniref:hypothetical protein n=1 Tax=Sphingobium sp. YR657 TaxID=1884366 RepID=UPI003137F6D1